MLIGPSGQKLPPIGINHKHTALSSLNESFDYGTNMAARMTEEGTLMQIVDQNVDINDAQDASRLAANDSIIRQLLNRKNN